MSSNTAKFGVYKGRVVDAADPLKQGRVRALVPSVLGTQRSNWAEPLLNPKSGPRVNDAVFIQFLDGDISHPVYSLPVALRRDIELHRSTYIHSA